MRHRLVFVVLAVATTLSVACTEAPLEPIAPRVFSGIGAHNAAQWMDPSVPGSGLPRAGTSLPIYFVCPVDGDTTARAAAILTDAELRLYPNGSAEIRLDIGSWARVNGVETASGETITRWGRWADANAQEITLSGFGLPGLGNSLQHTELGHAALSLTLACPGAAAVPNVQPTVSFSLGS